MSHWRNFKFNLCMCVEHIPDLEINGKVLLRLCLMQTLLIDDVAIKLT